MAHKSKIPTVILEPDSLNKGNTIPKGSFIITAPKKKKPKPRLGPKPKLGPKAAKRPKGGWTA